MRFGMHLETAAILNASIRHELAIEENQMNALEKNIAIARGEAMAASLLASAAMQTALLLVPPNNRVDLLARMSAFVDDALNASGPGNGDANDVFSTQMRETARFMVMQHLDGITTMLNGPPTRG